MSRKPSPFAPLDASDRARAENERWHTIQPLASTPPARPGRDAIPYTHAIGEAGQAYIKKVSPNGDAVLGGNFYYANLWDAMQEAALGGIRPRPTRGEIVSVVKRAHDELGLVDPDWTDADWNAGVIADRILALFDRASA